MSVNARKTDTKHHGFNHRLVTLRRLLDPPTPENILADLTT